MPANLFDLTGRVALITGGNKGLGKALARGFAEAGADVAVEDGLDPVEEEVSGVARGVGHGSAFGGDGRRGRDRAPGRRAAPAGAFGRSGPVRQTG